MKHIKPKSVVVIVYLAFLVDNLLLTAVVPILPAFLQQLSMRNELRNNKQTSLWKAEETITQENINSSPPSVNISNTKGDVPYLQINQTLLKHVPATKSYTSTELSLIDEDSLLFNSTTIPHSKEKMHEKKVPYQKLVGVSFSRGRTIDIDNSDGGRIGLMLSSRSIVQLFMNPVVGKMAQANGYAYPLLFGGFALLSSSLAYIVSNSYAQLVFARSLHGVASSFLTVSGLGMIANAYPDDNERGKTIGRVMGGVAMGVLLGYPLGSISYALTNSKLPTFILIGLLSALLTGFTMINVGGCCRNQSHNHGKASITELWNDSLVCITGFAILVSTSAMAVLEPCLPIWLSKTIKPEKWQMGTAFLPDSMGYLIGTTFGGNLANKVGRPKMAIMANVLLAISCIMLPFAKSMTFLAIPHMGLGLAVGSVDSALMPLLADLVDQRHGGAYAAVYSVVQAAVAGAYCLGPLLGSLLASWVGFPSTIRIIGLMNALYIPYLVYLHFSIKQNLQNNILRDFNLSPIIKVTRSNRYETLE